MVKEMNTHLRAYRQLANQLQHDPTVDDIAKYLDKPVKLVEKMLKLSERVTSIDIPLKQDSDKSLIECIAEEDRPNLPEILQSDKLSSSVSNWLDQLTDKQREVVCMRYGLQGHDHSTLEEVALVTGVTRERVRQIQMESLRRLREILEIEGYTAEALFH